MLYPVLFDMISVVKWSGRPYFVQGTSICPLCWIDLRGNRGPKKIQVMFIPNQEDALYLEVRGADPNEEQTGWEWGDDAKAPCLCDDRSSTRERRRAKVLERRASVYQVSRNGLRKAVSASFTMTPTLSFAVRRLRGLTCLPWPVARITKGGHDDAFK